MSEQEAPLDTKRENSRLGKASFVVSISGVLVLIIGVFIVFWVQGDAEMNPGIAMVQVLLLWIFGMGFIIVEFVALGLGIGGLCQKEKKKTLAKLGTVFSSVGLLIMAVLIIQNMVWG